MADIYGPIWQDTEYSFVSDTEYGIYAEERYKVPGNQVIVIDVPLYKGKVYVAPSERTVDVNINRICQNYLEDVELPLDGAATGISGVNKFKLKVNDELINTYYFYRDWSYKPLTSGVKTKPIIPFIGTGQRLFFTALYDDTHSSTQYEVTYSDKESYTNTAVYTNTLHTTILLLSRLDNLETFRVQDDVYTRLPLCKCKYVLYYFGPYGDWTWLPILGRVTKKDKIDQYTYTKNYNNTKTEFGKYRYLSEIHTTYTLHTGWLTQAQSDRMWEVLESNCVYLHNLEEDKIIPVVITQTEVDYKQKSNKSKMIDYEIIVEESQTKERL